MKALLLEAAGVLNVREVEPPSVKTNETLIDIQISGLGGSEYLGYLNPGIRSLPSIMGHGIAGLSSEGARVAVNPLLSCKACEFCKAKQYQLCDDWTLIGVQRNGGFAENVAVPIDALVDIPDGMTWEQAAFIEPFANSINAWELSGATEVDRVGIVGLGSLGLGLVACANANGCSVISAIEPSPQRRNAAIALGATDVAPTFPGAYDIVFDTVGSAKSRRSALELTRKAGRIVLLGFASPTMEINASEFIRHQKQMIGAFVYSEQQFSSAIFLAAQTDSSWVKTLTFAEVEPTLKKFTTGDFSLVKAALCPNRG